MYKYGVVIGRFSPFHVGHENLLEMALDVAEHIVVVVGSSYQARDTKNPFTFEERKAMISWTLADKGLRERVTIVGVRDHHYNDSLWATEVAAKVSQATYGSTSVALVGHYKDSSSYYLNSFPEWDLVTVPAFTDTLGFEVGATRIRDSYFTSGGENPIWRLYLPRPVKAKLVAFGGTPEYRRLREEYKYLQEYPKQWGTGPFLTVDAVVFCRGHVLLVERGGQPGKGLLAVPGGFLEPGERLLDGAIRELQEETGLIVDSSQLVGSEVFDSPYRSLRGRLISHAYHFVLDPSAEKLATARGTDDAAHAFWVPIWQALSCPERMFEDHGAIVSRFATTNETR